MDPFPLQFFSIDFSKQSCDFAFLRLSPVRRAAYFDLLRLDCLNDGIPENDDLSLVPGYGVAVEDLIAVADAFFTARSETTGRRSLPRVDELRRHRMESAAAKSAHGRAAVALRKVRPVKAIRGDSPVVSKVDLSEVKGVAKVDLSKIKPCSCSCSCSFNDSDKSESTPAVAVAHGVEKAKEQKTEAHEERATLELLATDAGQVSPTTQKRGKTAKEPQEMPFKSEAFAAVWQEYERHRVEKRQKLTPTARARALKTCGQYPEAVAIKTITASIEAGWTGLFFDKFAPTAPTPEAKPQPVINHAAYFAAIGEPVERLTK